MVDRIEGKERRPSGGHSFKEKRRKVGDQVGAVLIHTSSQGLMLEHHKRLEIVDLEKVKKGENTELLLLKYSGWYSWRKSCRVTAYSSTDCPQKEEQQKEE